MAAYEFVTDTGVIIPDTSTVLAEVEAEWIAIFGADLDLDPETPEGVLIAAEVTNRIAAATNNALLANQINPDFASGTFIDAIWALTGGARAAATRSGFSTNVDLTGVSGTLIFAGTIAATTAGDQFVSTVTTPILGGVASVPFVSVETGAIPCPINSLTVIVTAVIGWETVNNPVAATLGVATQTDISTRAERKQTLGAQGSALSVAVFSKVRAVANVTSLTFRENQTAVAITPTPPDNIDLVANSVWVCVSGGTDADVAAALLNSKTAGADWNNGNSALPVTEVVLDTTSGQNYTVEFDRPDLIPVLYRVTILPTTISNSSDIIKNAVEAYVNGELDGLTGLDVGADVTGWSAAAAVGIVEPGLIVTKVEVTTVLAASFQTATIDIELFEQATADASSVSVLIA